MKKLLLFLFAAAPFLGAKAQTSCSLAIPVTVDTPVNVAGTDSGTYPTGAGICAFDEGDPVDNGFDNHAKWYKYTATAAGFLTVDAVLDANDIDAIDTRVRILSGTCGSFTCVAQNDDFAFPTDFRSRVTFPTVAGTVYYIVWDNMWTSDPFTFVATFATSFCDVPSGFAFATANDPSTNGANLVWDAPEGDAPMGYQVEYGPTGFTQGTGTLLSPTSPAVSIVGLTEGTVYDVYFRTQCSADSFSTWVGPLPFMTTFSPANLPYAYGFETVNGDGWAFLDITGTEAWGFFNQDPEDPSVPAQEGQTFAAATGAGIATDSWLFSRGLNVTAGTVVTVNYYIRKVALAGAGNVNNLKVTAGTDVTVAAQTIPLATFNNYGVTDYTLQTNTFTAPTTGVYFIGFEYTAPIQAQINFGGILLDNVTVSGALSNGDFLASKFSVYPNPANNVVNISNAENILVNGVQIVDINGRTVKSLKYDGVSEAQINISDLSSGMYLMNISSDKGTLTRKVVKQ